MRSGVARMLEGTLRHFSAVLEHAQQADLAASQKQWAQRIDPRIKVFSALLITIAAVAVSRLRTAAALLMLLSVLALLARIPWRRLLAAWTGGLFFAAVVALPAIFTNGWKLAALLVSRSEVCLTCWLVVIMTTPVNRLFRALRALHIPLVFVAMLSMTFRYIFLLVETAQDMLFARRARIVGPLTASQNRKLIASTTGVLLSKSIQISDDVFHAMVARGFRGEVYLLDDFKTTAFDWLTLTAVIALLLLIVWTGR